MSPPRRITAWALVLCACTQSDAERHELSGITVVESFDDPICAGTFPYFESRLRWLERTTGLSRDPLGLVYHWYLDSAQLEESCNFPLGGCTRGRTLYGNLLVFSHELVHAHLERLGRPRVWLQEGMATMLADEVSFPVDPSSTPSSMLQIDEARTLDYAAAGAFTRFLLERYGMTLLLDYYAASADTDAATSQMIFDEIFGDGFADVEGDYLDGGIPDAHTSLDCDAPEIAWSGETWTHQFRLSCEEPDAIGPEQSQSAAAPGTILWSSVTMTAPPGWISLDLDSPEPAWLGLLSCEGPQAVYVAADQPHADVLLTGGRYLVLADAFIADAPTAVLTIRRMDAAPSPLQPAASSGSPIRGKRRDRACSRLAEGSSDPT